MSEKTVKIDVLHGDSLEVLRSLPADSISAVVTDPPYGLGKPPDMVEVLESWLYCKPYNPKGRGFMGKSWDAFVPGPELWREVFRVMKPGAHAAVFAGTRTQDVMGLALRLAGFEIRDSVAWLYGSGFPKSLDVSKAIDAAQGAERPVVGSSKTRKGDTGGQTYAAFGEYQQTKEVPITAPGCPESSAWAGWGTALKPGHEPILIVRKPFHGTVAGNVLAHGTGGINVDAGRIAYESEADRAAMASGVEAIRERGGVIEGSWKNSSDLSGANPASSLGRWPANVAMDEAAAADLDATVGDRPSTLTGRADPSVQHTHPADPLRERESMFGNAQAGGPVYADGGGPSRFFYCPKASRSEREYGLEDFPEVRRTDGRKTEIENPRLRTTPRRNVHPTVKPVELMRWLLRLLVPPGGVFLDPFGGSGTTGIAAAREGFDALLIEREAEYVEIARARIVHHLSKPVDNPPL